MLRFPFLFILLLSMFSGLHAQKDSIIFINNNVIVGEVKSMDENVFEVETSYSDDDFKIEWDGVKEIYTSSTLLMTLSDGRRLNGSLRSSTDSTVVVETVDSGTVICKLSDIVFMESIDDDFSSRLYASIDLGFSITKSQNLIQITSRSNIGYIASHWSLDAKYHTLQSVQDNTDPIRRNDGGLSYKYFLAHDWFLVASLDFLSNTEQQLDLRNTTNIGLGRFFVRSNKLYWSMTLGVLNNWENYYEDDDDRRSFEALVGTELNIFNFDDFNLYTKLSLYPSLTEKRRWRMDYNLDLKYDLPYDIYISAGLTLNYDNKAVSDASSTDYVFDTGIGWEW